MLTVAPSATSVFDAVEEADVLVGHEHVHEAAQLALVVEEPLGEARVRGLEGLEHVGDGARLRRRPRRRRR